MATEETKDKYKEGLVISLGSRKKTRKPLLTNLFSTIRLLDEENVDIILSEGGVDLSQYR